MAELVDAADFDSADESLGGSSPSSIASGWKLKTYLKLPDISRLKSTTVSSVMPLILLRQGKCGSLLNVGKEDGLLNR